MKKNNLILILILSLTMILSGCSSNSKGGDKAVEFTQGVSTETGFESEYLNLKFEAPQGFVMATEEEILNMSDLGAEYAELDKDIIDYSKAVNVYEMMAVDPATSANVIVMTEKLSLSNMKLEEYMEALKTQLTSVSNMNYKIEEETSQVVIAGKEYTKLSTTATVSDVKLIQNYYLRMENGRAEIIITSFIEQSADKEAIMLGGFSELNK